MDVRRDFAETARYDLAAAGSGLEARVTTTFLGRGIYSLQEAARLTRVPARRVRRWLCGYDYSKSGNLRRSPPVWTGDYQLIDSRAALSFLDLVELNFIECFIRTGVSWKTMRRAHQKAQVLVESTHPFCTNAFATDGNRIFADLQEAIAEEGLIDVVSSQRYFENILRPFLLQLEFSKSKELLRWSPLGPSRHVVLDPRRNFGRPITRDEAAPTRSLYLALRAGNSPAQVASWYEVSRHAVTDAKTFEDSLAA